MTTTHRSDIRGQPTKVRVPAQLPLQAADDQALSQSCRIRRKNVAYGCILELAQVYIPGRSGTIEDALADGLGVMIGMGIVRVLRWRFSSTIAAGPKQPFAD